MKKKGQKILSLIFSIILVLLLPISVFAGNKDLVTDSSKPIQYNGIKINYNQDGLPTNYVGETFSEPVSGDLVWNNNLITTFETDEYRYFYQYNENNRRTKKIIYNTSKINDDPVCILDYIWENNIIKGFNFTNKNNKRATINILFDEKNNILGFVDNHQNTYLSNTSENGQITKIVSESNVPIADISYTKSGAMKLELKNQDLSYFDEEELFFVLVSISIPIPNAVYDYESGLTYTAPYFYSDSWNTYLNLDLPKQKNFGIQLLNSSYITVTKYKDSGFTWNAFGHLDISINGSSYSYSNHNYPGQGNYLIAGSTTAYQNNMRSQGKTLASTSISVSDSEKSQIIWFFVGQSRVQTGTSSGYSGGYYYKITEGKYKQYNLLTANCATFVRDSFIPPLTNRMKAVDSNYLSYNTPAQVFGLCQLL